MEKLLLLYPGVILLALIIATIYYVWLRKVNKDAFNLTNKGKQHNNFKIVNRR